MSGVTKHLQDLQPSVVELTDKELEKVNGAFLIPINNSLALAITNVALATPGTALAVSSVAFANNNSGMF
jgi:hypothetical protein